MNIYISHNYRNLTSAGNKAKSDVERIMASEGFRNIGNCTTYHQSKIANYFLNLGGIIKASLRMRKGDVLFLQYPLKKYFSIVCRMAHFRGVKVVALVHDLGSCRRKALSIDKELRRLGHADHVIATNEVMGHYLKEIGLRSSVSSLDLWDYLTATDPIPSRVKEGNVRIAYAGSLNRRKSSFLWTWGDMIDGYTVDIYGQGFRMDEVACPECFCDHGFVDAEQLISGMTSDYGLVWDGDSTDGCKGDFGEYLALNTPHKVSLYLRARLPLIIWSGAALAGFVKKRGIGITVDSLSEIKDRIKTITPDEYFQMKNNVEIVSGQIATGHYFRKSIRESLSVLSNNARVNE